MGNWHQKPLLTTGKGFSHEEKWEKGTQLSRTALPDFKTYIFWIILIFFILWDFRIFWSFFRFDGSSSEPMLSAWILGILLRHIVFLSPHFISYDMWKYRMLWKYKNKFPFHKLWGILNYLNVKLWPKCIFLHKRTQYIFSFL